MIRLSVRIRDNQPNTATLFINHDFTSRLNSVGSEGATRIVIVSFRFLASDSLPVSFAIVII